MQVERGMDSLLAIPSGKRVSNAWTTCRKDGDNIPKGVLIPDGISLPHGGDMKGSKDRLAMGPRLIS